jgi:hypothetical protein
VLLLLLHAAAVAGASPAASHWKAIPSPIDQPILKHRLKRYAPPRKEHEGTTTGAIVLTRGATLTVARRTTLRDVKQPKAVLLRINEAAMAAVCCCQAGSRVPAANNITLNQTPSPQIRSINTT